jgi:rhodanese-related sulfurtransferase
MTAVTVDEMLEQARTEIERLSPEDTARWQRDGAWLVDIRPQANRDAEGEIPGALPVERIVLEWRLDPAGPDRLPGFTADIPVVVFCNEGYASSLAARDLRRLGVRAADLVGGYRAWREAELPTRPLD